MASYSNVLKFIWIVLMMDYGWLKTGCLEFKTASYMPVLAYSKWRSAGWLCIGHNIIDYIDKIGLTLPKLSGLENW